MPARSKSQLRLMQAAAHNQAFAKKAGVQQKVAKEFVGEQSVNLKSLPERLRKKGAKLHREPKPLASR